MRSSRTTSNGSAVPAPWSKDMDSGVLYVALAASIAVFVGFFPSIEKRTRALAFAVATCAALSSIAFAIHDVGVAIIAQLMTTH